MNLNNKNNIMSRYVGEVYPRPKRTTTRPNIVHQAHSSNVKPKQKGETSKQNAQKRAPVGLYKCVFITGWQSICYSVTFYLYICNKT